MRKKGSTEDIITKHSVEMEAEIDEKEPLEPKELVDWEKSDKEITGTLETIEVILQLSDINDGAEKWLQEKGYNVLKDSEGKEFIIGNDGYVLQEPIRRVLEILYGRKYAYLKKGDFELYGEVEIKRYNRRLETPLGNIIIPIVTVNNKPIFFNSKWCLSEEEKATYSLYNNKNYDLDRMELEKKIMADLIAYSKLGTKSIEDSKTIFDKIKKECEQLGVLEKISFTDGVFQLHFTWRMGIDSAGKKPSYVLPPFTIIIDFNENNLRLKNWHPHRFSGGFCLGGELTKIKDKCFENKDIYGLVMAMVQFANTWNSADVGTGDRHPGYCIINYFRDNGLVADKLNDLPVPFAEIFNTVAQINWSYFSDNRETRELVRDLIKKDDGFCASIKGKDYAESLIQCYADNEVERTVYRERLGL